VTEIRACPHCGSAVAPWLDEDEGLIGRCETCSSEAKWEDWQKRFRTPGIAAAREFLQLLIDDCEESAPNTAAEARSILDLLDKDGL
jgi:hypothetical protein